MLTEIREPNLSHDGLKSDVSFFMTTLSQRSGYHVKVSTEDRGAFGVCVLTMLTEMKKKNHCITKCVHSQELYNNEPHVNSFFFTVQSVFRESDDLCLPQFANCIFSSE